MPNLDNLKKQAKQIQRWHAERQWTVAEIIRLTLPRYRGLSDRQVLERPFKLADAQELVARREGFDSWPALLQGLPEREARTDPAPERPRLAWVTAHVFVADVAAACAWYGKVLGFTNSWTYGEPPYFGQVTRDSFKLSLRSIDEPVLDRALCAREDLMSADFGVDDVKALYLEVQAAGAEFHQALRTEPWGQRLSWSATPTAT